MALDDHLLAARGQVLLHRRPDQHVRPLLLQGAVDERRQVVQADARHFVRVAELVVVRRLRLPRRHLVDPALRDEDGDRPVPDGDLDLLLTPLPLPVQRHVVAAYEVGLLVVREHLAAREGDVPRQDVRERVLDALVRAAVGQAAVRVEHEGCLPRARAAKKVLPCDLGVQGVQDGLPVGLDLLCDDLAIALAQRAISRLDHQGPDGLRRVQDLIQRALRVLQERHGVLAVLLVVLVGPDGGLQLKRTGDGRGVLGQVGVLLQGRQLLLEVLNVPVVALQRTQKSCVGPHARRSAVHVLTSPLLTTNGPPDRSR